MIVLQYDEITSLAYTLSSSSDPQYVDKKMIRVCLVKQLTILLKDSLFSASVSSMALLASIPYINLPAITQPDPTSKRHDFWEDKVTKKELLLYPKVRSF